MLSGGDSCAFSESTPTALPRPLALHQRPTEPYADGVLRSGAAASVIQFEPTGFSVVNWSSASSDSRGRNHD